MSVVTVVLCLTFEYFAFVCPVYVMSIALLCTLCIITFHRVSKFICCTYQERGIDGSIFQNRYKLHMTLGTMVLLDDCEIARADTLLQECMHDFVRRVNVYTVCEIIVHIMQFIM